MLLPAADGWVHPGPPTAWPDFTAMAVALGAPAPDGRAGALPDVSMLSAGAIDHEAEQWMLPAVAVRAAPAAAPRVRWPRRSTRVDGARVVVLGSTWAAPLTGLVLRRLGAEVVRVTHPAVPTRSRCVTRRPTTSRRSHSTSASIGIATPSRICSSAPISSSTAPRRACSPTPASTRPAVSHLRIAAFADSDRPGYGIAAECRGGWAARHDPPRVGRSSVADPIAGLLAALVAVEMLADDGAPAFERVALEDAVGHLLLVERAVPESRIHVRGRGPVTEIVFDHPPINIYDVATRDELCDVLTALHADPDVRVLVFTAPRATTSPPAPI